MPGCIFHVIGEDFHVEVFLAESSLRPYRVHERGKLGPLSRPYTNSGFSLDVSSANSDLKTQITDAIAFLSTHEVELQRLHHFPGVTDIRLDFGYFYRNVAAQVDYLPPALLSSAGKLGIGIELSLYTVPMPHSTMA